MRLALALLTALLVAGCAAPDASPSGIPSPTPAASPSPSTSPSPSPPPSSTATMEMGVSFSPKSFSATDFPRFFDEVPAVGGLVLWGGAASELANTSSAAHVIATLAQQKGLRFAAQLGYHQEGVAFDEPAQAAALDELRDYAQTYKPAYLILGVELDRVHDKDPAHIDAFAAWYPEAYDAVKSVSPQTSVFPTFQLERTMGMTGGIYGEAESRPPKWDLVERFEKRDMTAFTTYPGYVYRDVEEIPADHYTALADRFDGPIGFSEVGYNAGLTIPSFETSEIEQASFVTRFLDDAANMDAALAVWLHLYDQELDFEPTETLGLIDRDGVKRDAYDIWARAASS